jgi:hypothetical protein
MKKLLALFLLACSSVLAQNTAFPPKVGETWRLEVEGLTPAIAKFTTNSNALPGAVDGDVEIGTFKGRTRSVANQGQQIILWQSPDGVYYCVFTASPTIQGAKVQGIGAALERPNQQPIDLNKGCSATNITSGGTGTTGSSGTGTTGSISTSTTGTTTTPTAAKPDAPIAVPPETPVAQDKIEVGQNWRLSVSQNDSVLNGDAYNLRVLRPAGAVSVPSNLSKSTTWFEVAVETIQRFTDFSRIETSSRPIKGVIKYQNGVITALLENNAGLACEANTRNLQGWRFVGGMLSLYDSRGASLPTPTGLGCNLQFAGSASAIPADAAAVLENAKRSSGSAATWAGLKNIGFRGENKSDIVRQTITIVDFVGMRLYKEYLQGPEGNSQIITKKEWQLPAAGSRRKGTYVSESGRAAVFAYAETPDLERLLYTDFWALRFGGLGWDNATVEPIGNGMQLLTVGRKGYYTRFIISSGKYNGFQTAFSLFTLTVQPEQLADAGGILAPLGTWKITASSGQPFDQSLVERLVRVGINLNLPADLWEPK